LSPLPTSFNDLQLRITGIVAEVTPNKLRRTWRKIRDRWDICHATFGNRTVALIYERKLEKVVYISI
jgi:hypothetical protein